MKAVLQPIAPEPSEYLLSAVGSHLDAESESKNERHDVPLSGQYSLKHRSIPPWANRPRLPECAAHGELRWGHVAPDCHEDVGPQVRDQWGLGRCRGRCGKGAEEVASAGRD